MKYKLWIDLDGVLLDWTEAACQVLGEPTYPDSGVLHRYWLSDELKISMPDVLDRIQSKGSLWSIAKPTAIFPELVTYLDTTFPDWGILSSGGLNPETWAGKLAWVKRYLGNVGAHRLVVTGGRKSNFAHPRAVLVDDHWHNAEHWMQAGGHAFHWKEFVRSAEDLQMDQFRVLREFLHPYSPAQN